MVKLTAELIEQAAQYTNAVRDRELDLRGAKDLPGRAVPGFGGGTAALAGSGPVWGRAAAGRGLRGGGREACTGNGPCRAGGVVLRVLWIFPLRCVPKAAFHLVLCFPDLWALILSSRFPPRRV